MHREQMPNITDISTFCSSGKKKRTREEQRDDLLLFHLPQYSLIRSFFLLPCTAQYRPRSTHTVIRSTVVTRMLGCTLALLGRSFPTGKVYKRICRSRRQDQGTPASGPCPLPCSRSSNQSCVPFPPCPGLFGETRPCPVPAKSPICKVPFLFSSAVARARCYATGLLRCCFFPSCAAGCSAVKSQLLLR